MKVRIKDLSVEMEVKTRGIELQVSDNKKQLGDIVVKNSGLVWCEGKTNPKNGISISWRKFISWAVEQSSKNKKNGKPRRENNNDHRSQLKLSK